MAVAVGVATIGVEYVFGVRLTMIRVPVDGVIRAIRRQCMPRSIASKSCIMLAEPRHNGLAGQQRQNTYGYYAAKFKHWLEDRSSIQ